MNKFWHSKDPEDGGGGGGGEPIPVEPPADPPTEPPKEPEPVEAKWPENWREQIAGEDEKSLKQLGRYATPNDVWNKARALEQRLSSGELKSTEPFPEEGKDEEKATWRTENGVPETAEKYDLSLPEGFVIGERDKPAIDDYLEYAHTKNIPTAVVSDSVNWFFKNQEKQAELRKEADLAVQETNTDQLRADWGDEYRQNVNRINGLLDTAPEEVKTSIKGARLPDGTPLGSDSGVLKFLVQLAHEINPATTLVPGSGANVMNAIGDEISAIEKTMREDRKAYNADEKMQSRYRQLLEARDKQKSKAA